MDMSSPCRSCLNPEQRVIVRDSAIPLDEQVKRYLLREIASGVTAVDRVILVGKTPVTDGQPITAQANP